mmetsp:Transcript_40461/g.85502  ORF Transcript_40461/g.85502 Transcript_40461/m.85502 type:complete len:679 (+) Transcript_40461:23-2059(+)
MPDSGSGNVRDPTSPESPLSPGSPGRRVRPELNRARSGLSAPRSPDRARTRANREGLKRQASKKSSPQSTAKTDAPQSQERFRAQLAAVHHLSGSIGTRPRASGFWDPSRPHLGILKTALACGHLDAVSELTRDCRCADIVPADDPCTAACHLDELDERWRSLLHLSASAGQLPIVKMLLKRRASLEHRDDRGRTALHRAVQNGRDKVCQELLKTRADTNATDMDGLTPLHVAAMSDTRWCAIYLVLAGSSISLLSGHGLSPILTARMARNFAMERLLATMNDEDTLPWWMEDGQIEKLASGEVPFYRGGEVYSPSAEEEKWLAALRDHEPSSSKFFFDFVVRTIRGVTVQNPEDGELLEVLNTTPPVCATRRYWLLLATSAFEEMQRSGDSRFRPPDWYFCHVWREPDFAPDEVFNEIKTQDSRLGGNHLGKHPLEQSYVWLDKACLPQSPAALAEMRNRCYFLVETVLLSDKLWAVWSPSFFSRLWCVVELGLKLAVSELDKVHVEVLPFLTPRGGATPVPIQTYVDAIRNFSVRSCTCTLEQDVAIIRRLLRRLVSDEAAFDRWIKFCATILLFRHTYETKTCALLAAQLGLTSLFEALSLALAVDETYPLNLFDGQDLDTITQKRQRRAKLNAAKHLWEQKIIPLYKEEQRQVMPSDIRGALLEQLKTARLVTT